ncbi:protein PFC0760c-like isoform X2 [Gordionus sp. m RMFG-2023]|uniref:protein PFC0760c-like isoform X2 n=1 Tax=Gordionus sp. m RMFG-2023 TaxID=3053472 RepID=UPI0031FBDEDC
MIDSQKREIFNNTKILFRKHAKREKIRQTAKIIRKIKYLKIQNNLENDEIDLYLEKLKSIKLNSIGSALNLIVQGKLLKTAMQDFCRLYANDWKDIIATSLSSLSRKKITNIRLRISTKNDKIISSDHIQKEKIIQNPESGNSNGIINKEIKEVDAHLNISQISDQKNCSKKLKTSEDINMISNLPIPKPSKMIGEICIGSMIIKPINQELSKENSIDELNIKGPMDEKYLTTTDEIQNKSSDLYNDPFFVEKVKKDCARTSFNGVISNQKNKAKNISFNSSFVDSLSQNKKLFLKEKCITNINNNLRKGPQYNKNLKKNHMSQNKNIDKSTTNKRNCRQNTELNKSSKALVCSNIDIHPSWAAKKAANKKQAILSSALKNISHTYQNRHVFEESD